MVLVRTEVFVVTTGMTGQSRRWQVLVVGWLRMYL